MVKAVKFNFQLERRYKPFSRRNQENSSNSRTGLESDKNGFTNENDELK